ncbi:MAG TPA: PAS domain S-box protein [Candidatus Acidoferrum sp.]|nr:PAS domain S-box protein [Candidatus Acidoferrum sp.]
MATPSRKKLPNAAPGAGAHLESSAWDLAELRNIYRNAPVGFYSVDRDFRFVRVNEYLAKLNGRTVADHIGRRVRDIMPAFADGLERLYRQVLESGQPIYDVGMEWIPPAAPGQLHDKISNYYPLESEDGSIIGVSAVVRDVTEQVRVERALHEREERYRLLFEKANDGLFVFRVNREGAPGKFLEANAVACRMLEYSREELLKLSPIDFQDAPVPDPYYFIRQAVEKGQIVYERQVRTKSGAKLPVEISATAFELRGEPAILSVVRDISERKLAEAELRRTIDLNDQILSSAQEGVVVADHELRIVVWNAFVENLTGVKKQEAIGRNALELFPSLREVGMEGLAERALAGEYITGLDLPFQVSTTGRSGWVAVSAGPLRNSDGNVIGTLTMLRDITERRQMEAALRESSEFNKQVIENTGEGISVCDREHRTLLWNPFMEEITGRSAEEVLGKNQLDLFPFLRAQGIDTFFNRALQGETCFTPEFRYRSSATNKSGWAVSRFCPLRNSKGEIIGVLSNLREVTESKEREEELRRLSSRLLQLQDEERRRIARDLHDSFAQRVLAVNLNLTLLEQAAGPLEERARRAVTETREIMSDFAKEIRSLSYVLHPPVLDELGLASAIEEFASGFSERSGIHVEVEIAPQAERLPQEAEVALFRIVQEALSNVQRHSGSPTAKIRIVQQDHQLILEVADQGHWRARRRSREPRSEAERLGVGILGMRERMRQLGGSLEIVSGATGTTVRGVLPLKKELQSAIANPDR